MTYQEMKNKQPELHDCFFAFNNQQFAEGIAKHSLEGKKLCSAGAGLYGTREGITQLFNDYKKIRQGVAKHCDPQEVYDYEHDNHECSYTGDDEEAIRIVVQTFGKDIAKTVKRRHSLTPVDAL